MPPWLSQLCLVLVKYIQFDISVFSGISANKTCEEICEAVNGSLRGSKCDESFYKKVSFPFNHVAFFQNIFTSTSREVFN